MKEHMSTYTLNFTLTTDLQRTEYIASICASTTYTQKQLTQMADYILLASNKNHPDSTFIYPEEFQNPKRTHTQDSLDEILDSSDSENDFCILESTFRPIQPTIYKKTPRKIDRNNPILSNNPQMRQLWSEIDRIDSILSTTTNYKLSKLSISLHKQQYDILESILPQWPIPIPSSDNSTHFYPWNRGIYTENNMYADIDLRNYAHMAKFLKYMPELSEYCSPDNNKNYMYSDLYQMLQDTQNAIQNAHLSPIHTTILYLYWNGIEGKKILQILKDKYGKIYNQPTLSTIFNYTIAKKICTEYTEIYNERLYRNCPDHWRTCPKCGTTKLLSPYNFHRASGKPKGYAPYCKECSRKQKHKIK